MIRSKSVLIPFMSDSISSKHALSVSDHIALKAGYGVEIIPLKLDLGYEFHSDKITASNKLFKNCLSAEFSLSLQESILLPKYSYRDKSNSFVKALNKIIEKYDKKNNNNADKPENNNEEYYKQEKVYRELRNKLHGELVENMKEFADETDTEKLKNCKIKIDEIIKNMNLIFLKVFQKDFTKNSVMMLQVLVCLKIFLRILQ